MPEEPEIAGVAAGRIRRMPPHSNDAEQGLLAACMLDAEQEVLNACLEARLTHESFYMPVHQVLYHVMVGLYGRQQPVEEVSVIDALQSQTVASVGWLKGQHKAVAETTSLLAHIGGPGVVSDILDRIDTTAHALHWLEIVREKWLLRRLIATTTQISESAYVNQDQLSHFIDKVEHQILSINEDRIQDSAQKFSHAVDTAQRMISSLMEGRQENGVMTGYRDIDGMTFGLHGGQMVVLAARPSMGKTSLAMNIVENIAVPRSVKTEGQGVLVFSLEMPSDQLAMRMLCGRARVNMKRVRERMVSKEEVRRLVTSSGELSAAPMWVDDASSVNILEMRAKARRMVRQNSIRLIVVDYLQLISGTDSRVQREQQISEISRGLKGMAKELNVPVLVLSQLNRAAEKDNRAPRLSDLRESGAIEQDADVVFLLAPRTRGGEDSPLIPQASRERQLIIAKQRNGPTGEVPLTFIPDFTRFEDFAEEREP